MAAVKSTTPRDVEFRRIIEGYIAVSGLNKDKISANLGISHKCLCNWMNNPGEFRVMYLRRLCDMIHVKDEDRRRLI